MHSIAFAGLVRVLRKLHMFFLDIYGTIGCFLKMQNKHHVYNFNGSDFRLKDGLIICILPKLSFWGIGFYIWGNACAFWGNEPQTTVHNNQTP